MLKVCVVFVCFDDTTFASRDTNEKKLFSIQGWRRSHRPSLYDISIIDEEEDRNKDPELQADEKTLANTSTNQGRPLPIYTVTK